MLLLEREINKNGSKSKEGLFEVVEVVKEEIDRLNKLMKDCLEFSKSGSLNREYEDVGQIIKELLSLVNFHADLNGIKIHTNTLEKYPKILIDKDKIKQALLNIVLNAMESMSGGGDINIKIAKSDRCLKISIKDTGTGIPEEQHDKIFDLFYSSKSGGAGLGLAITQNIIHAHGGNIGFKNLNNGTKFTIKLPLS
jgi:signal transduction histidine kinase